MTSAVSATDPPEPIKGPFKTEAFDTPHRALTLRVWLLRVLCSDDIKRIMFVQLKSMASYLTGESRGRHDALVARIDAALRSGPITWAQLFELETVTILHLSDDHLRRRVWKLREEFQRLSTAELYQGYLRSNPASPATADIAQVRYDVANLLEEVQRLRAGRRQMEAIRTYLTACMILTAITAVASLFIWTVFMLQQNAPLKFLQVMWLCVTCGVFGSVFSTIARLYTIPVKGDLVELSNSGWRNIGWLLTPLLSMVQGAVAALAMYVALQAGLAILSPTLMPSFLDETPGTGPGLLMPASTREMMKLLLWCFIAGFAERLMPDMLSQLATKASAKERPA